MSLGSSVQAHDGTSREQRGVEICGIVLTFLLTALLASRLFPSMSPSSWPLVALGVFAGFIGADFVSGVVHWLGDTWGNQHWPVLGRSLIRPFREHHVDPLAITRHGFVETNGNSSVGCVMLLALGLALPPADWLALFFDTALLSLSTWLFATNQIHKWAHAPAVPPIVGWLQRRRWILDPEHHAVHHCPPYDRYYCITAGWLNPPLTRAGFFPALERFIGSVTGAIPRAAEKRP